MRDEGRRARPSKHNQVPASIGCSGQYGTDAGFATDETTQGASPEADLSGHGPLRRRFSGFGRDAALAGGLGHQGLAAAVGE